MVIKVKIILLITALSSVAFASGSEIPMGTVISQIVNLSFLVGGLYFWQRKAIAQMFTDKKASFLENVAAASKSKKDAENILVEVTKRVVEMQSTFKKQVEEARVNADENYRSQLADAKNEAIRLKSMAETTLEFEVQKQVENLRVETFQKSAGLAEKTLKKDLTPDQLKAWNKSFATAQEGAH